MITEEITEPTKRGVGRPLGHELADVLERAQQWEEDGDRTVTGLALALGFTSRKQLIEYADRPEYRNALKRCRLMVENFYEQALMRGQQAAGPIFALKNLGWQDATTVSISAGDEFMQSILDTEETRISMDDEPSTIEVEATVPRGDS